MIEMCRDEIGPVMASDARPEAIFELANLILWLEDRIIDKKIECTPIERIDSDQERAALATSWNRKRIENTARLCADKIWKPFLDRWHRRFPLIRESPGQSSSLLRPREAPGVKSQHYSPSFSNEFWAVGPQKLIRIYSRTVGEDIISRDRGYTTWGREAFLYSQGLERIFQLIETDAKTPYTKLLDIIPMNEKERRFWIAFLIAQMLRTPTFMLRILPSLKKLIEESAIVFPVDTGSLRKAYETLFSNNDIYAEFFRLITARTWELWSAPQRALFIRGDDPVFVGGSVEHRTWHLIYPMTPDKCFVVGPELVADATAVIPNTRHVDESQVQMVNERVAKAARKSVISRPVQDDSTLRILLRDSLAHPRATPDWRAQLFPEFWGPIK